MAEQTPRCKAIAVLFAALCVYQSVQVLETIGLTASTLPGLL